jgi:preprotein translocase subunit SecG
MLDISLKVLFVLVALTMIVMILMQQGSASAGGLGGGASSTVFGSRGSSNFLSKSTRNLAIVFFALSLFMSWKVSHDHKVPNSGGGVISTEQQQAAQKSPASEVPQAPSLLPTVAKPELGLPSNTVPAAPVVVTPSAPVAAPQSKDSSKDANKEAAKPAEQGSK